PHPHTLPLRVALPISLTLDRPDRRNALSADLVAALRAALAEAAEDDAVRVVVLTGAGRAFSAGADLAALQALQTASAEANLADSEALAALFEAIYRHPKPVVAKVNGHASAGRGGSAAQGDFSIVAVSTKLVYNTTLV